MSVQSFFPTPFLSTVCAGALIFISPVIAQESAATDIVNDNPTEAEAQAAMLQAQLEALQAQIDALKNKAAKQEKAIAYKGAPEFSGDGWKFKMRGRFMYDGSIISNPRDRIAGKDFGFNSRVRRVRLGAEGDLGGGFGFSAEADFANSAVGFGDVVLKWKPKDSSVELTIGNHETFNSLEQQTSSRFISFNERAQIDEAFYSGRRLGVSATYVVPDTFSLQVGAFNDAIQSSLGNDDYLLGARAVYATKMGSTQLHFGGTVQYRRFQSNTQSNNYQARPMSQGVGTRFVATSGSTAFLNSAGTAAASSTLIGSSTSGISTKGDTSFGLEALAVNGPFHAVAQAQFLKSDAYPLTAVFRGGDATSGARLADNPSFWGGYAEIGYFLTGETRGYKGFKWDRTKVLNPVSKGGMGAFQVIARYDRLDLTDTVGSVIVNGGVQTAYQAGLQWLPIDYVRFYLNYARVEVKGGPLAATVVPVSTKAINERTYGSDVIQTRVAFDF
jgi:phosphate-selective porin OprO/OprP